MVIVKDEYSFEEICDNYLGGDVLLSLPSNIYFAISKWVENLSGGVIDFTNGRDKIFLPSAINNRLCKVKLDQLKDIEIDYELEQEGDSFNEAKLMDLFECRGYDYLGIDNGHVYYLDDDY